MARINSYALDQTPSLNDKILGSNSNISGNPTAQYSVSQLKDVITDDIINTPTSSSGILYFTKVNTGVVHGTKTLPITSNLVIDSTGQVEGGIVEVNWQGSSNPNITGVSDSLIQSIGLDITELDIYKIYIVFSGGTYTVNITRPELYVGANGGDGSPTENQRPVITLAGLSIVEVEVNDVYVDQGATALDNEDGDITANIVTVNNVDSSTIGSYIVTYNVDDSQGLSAIEVTRTVNVVSEITTETAPTITVTDEITTETAPTITVTDEIVETAPTITVT